MHLDGNAAGLPSHSRGVVAVWHSRLFLNKRALNNPNNPKSQEKAKEPPPSRNL